MSGGRKSVAVASPKEVMTAYLWCRLQILREYSENVDMQTQLGDLIDHVLGSDVLLGRGLVQTSLEAEMGRYVASLDTQLLLAHFMAFPVGRSLSNAPSKTRFLAQKERTELVERCPLFPAALEAVGKMKPKGENSPHYLTLGALAAYIFLVVPRLYNKAEGFQRTTNRKQMVAELKTRPVMHAFSNAFVGGIVTQLVLSKALESDDGDVEDRLADPSNISSSFGIKEAISNKYCFLSCLDLATVYAIISASLQIGIPTMTAKALLENIGIDDYAIDDVSLAVLKARLEASFGPSAGQATKMYNAPSWLYHIS